MNDLFKALSDKTRRDILELLKTRDMSAGEIASAFPISAASISHHLNILKQADLVASVRDGQNIIYSLNTSVFQDLVSWVFTLQGKD
ncbi:MAG: winged helix-turn-helix transcriptional regulator [Treponema sp.]|jgi:ArsR family transcriptional regulator|nr:winged helix-turn-helix transcriptional regulator [Treponema sp.]